MNVDDIKLLCNRTTSVESLTNYFRGKPMPTRRELAQIRHALAKTRYRDVDPALFDLLHPELVAAPPSCPLTQ